MSIIVTQITGLGIVHGADSNLTDAADRHDGEAKKLFAIPRHRAAITIAGTYAVGGEKMDVWLQSFISMDQTKTLHEFVTSLRDTINGLTSDCHGVSYIFHVAGYQGDGGTAHPELYHLRNVSIDRSGGYEPRGSGLRFTEDFWTQHGALSEVARFGTGRGYIYCNGFPSGRDAYFALLNRMAEFRARAWSEPSFRPPPTVVEEGRYLELDMQQIGLLFSHSALPAPYIGGAIQIYPIARP